MLVPPTHMGTALDGIGQVAEGVWGSILFSGDGGTLCKAAFALCPLAHPLEQQICLSRAKKSSQS